MLFREIVTVYCDNNTEHTNTLRGQNSESQYVKAGGSYSNRLALKGFKSLGDVQNIKERFLPAWLI
jgi:hypothetical protein